MKNYLLIILILQILISCQEDAEVLNKPPNPLNELVGSYCAHRTNNFGSIVYPFEIRSTFNPDSFIIILPWDLLFNNIFNINFEGDTLICAEHIDSVSEIAPWSYEFFLITIKSSGKGFINENSNELVMIFTEEYYYTLDQTISVQKYPYVLNKFTDYNFEGEYITMSDEFDTLKIKRSNTQKGYDIEISNNYTLLNERLELYSIETKCCLDIIGSNRNEEIKIIDGNIEFERSPLELQSNDYYNQLSIALSYKYLTGEDTLPKNTTFYYRQIKNLP